MNDVKLFINNLECDYSEIKGFEFNLTAQLRDFKKVVSVEGFELDNTSKLLPLPATKRNILRLKGLKTIIVPFNLTKNGVQLFAGKCAYISENYKNGTLKTLNLMVFGGNSDFIDSLNNLTLRDLDLGTDTLSSSRITSSWAETSNDSPGIFLPAVFGALVSENVNEWSVTDFRYHVYFDTILNGIASKLGIKIVSNFKSLDIWKRGVYAFGVGNEWRSTVQNSQTTTSTSLQHTITLTVVAKSVYSVYVYVPATGGATDLDHITVEASSGFVSADYAYTSGQTTIFNIQNISLNASDTISVKGHNHGHSLREMPSGVVFSIFGGYEVLENSEFNVNTCLHRNPIKNLFAAWVAMFNWSVFYNPIVKTLFIEPTFDYKIGSTRYNGFYTLPSSGYNELDDDVTESNISFNPIFDIVRFAYKESKLDNEVINYCTQNFEPLGTSTVIGTGKNIENFGDEYFERCYNGIFAGVTTGNRELPLLLDTNFDVKKDGNIAEKPTFLTNPICLFVSSTVLALDLEGSIVTGAPVSMQTNFGSLDDFTYSWCDVEVLNSGVSVTKKGLASTFYPHLFAIFRRFQVLNTKIRVKNVLSIDTFKKMYKLDNSFYILSKLSNVTTNNELLDAEFTEYIAIKDTDEANTTHNNLKTSQMLISIK